jgi:uncharacterized membrane protein YgcG
MVRTFRTAILVTGLGWFAAAGTAMAASAIKDESHIFSPQAREQAARDIEEISRLYHKDVFIEFLPSVPEGNWWNRFKKWMLYSKDPKSRQRFYEDWAKRSARAAGPNSIYVLIVKEPAPLHVEIAAGRDAQKKGGLMPADAKKLQERLQALFQKGDYNAGLEQTVREIGRVLRDNRDAAVVPPEEFPWAELGSLMGIMLGLWLCLQLMQKFLGNRDPERAVPLAEAGYGAGGSYLAGLYAALAGNGVRELFRSLRTRERPARAPVTEDGDAEALLSEAPFREADQDPHAAEMSDYIHDNPDR